MGRKTRNNHIEDDDNDNYKNNHIEFENDLTDEQYNEEDFIINEEQNKFDYNDYIFELYEDMLLYKIENNLDIFEKINFEEFCKFIETEFNL